MRIAFFDDRYFEVYGAQENTLLCAELCRQQGHEVMVYTTLDGPFAEAARQRDLPVAVLDADDSITIFDKRAIRGGIKPFMLAVLGAARFTGKLHRRIEADDIDLLITAAVRPALLAARTRASRRCDVMLYAQNSTPFGIFAAAALPGLSLVALIADEARTTFPSWSFKLFRPPTTVLASGRDLSHYSPATTRIPSSQLRLVSVCSITERKGLHRVFEAMHLAAESGIATSMTVVGTTNGPASEAYERQLHQQVSDLGLDVTWVGWSDVVPHLHAADLFVLGSSHEGLPGVLIEAAACGLPAITTNAGGSAQTVLDGVTGAVVPVGDVDAMAQQIMKFRDDSLRFEAGQAARRYAEDQFGLEAFSRRLANACKAATGSGHTP